MTYSWFIFSCLSSSKAQWTLRILLCTERIDDVQHLNVQINSYQCTCKSVGVTRFLLDEEPIMAGLEVLEDSEVLARTSSSRDDCLASSLSILVPMLSN